MQYRGAKHRIAFIAIHTLVIVAALIAVYYIYPRAHQLGGVYLPAAKEDLLDRARSILAGYAFTESDYRLQVRLQQNQNLHVYLYKEYGIEKANRLTRSELSLFDWHMRWDRTGESTDGEGSPPAGGWDGNESGSIRIDYNGLGRLTRFQYGVDDTIGIPSVAPEEAREIAAGFIGTHTGIPADKLGFLESTSRTQRNRTDHTFTWKIRQEEMERDFDLRITVAGNIVASYELNPSIPEDAASTQARMIGSFGSAFVYLLIAVLLVVMGFKRVRSGEIGFRYAIYVGVFITIVYGIQLFVFIQYDTEWYYFISFAFVALVFGGISTLGWAVSESLGRETWKEKFISFDLFGNWYVFHPRIGTAVLRGLAIGIALFAVWLASLGAASGIIRVRFVYDSDLLNFLNSFSPSMYILAQSGYVGILTLTFFVFPLTAILYRKTGSTAIAIGGAALLYGLGHGGFIQPLPFGIAALTLYGAALLYFFHRYDGLTVFIVIATAMTLEWGSVLFFAENTFFLHNGIYIALFLGALYVAAAGSIFIKDREMDYSTIAPSFQRVISERERLQREIEIAREVQMSFLPRVKPDIPVLDVAAKCIPANEVGGDYYDFIPLDTSRFGVVIGDVSGKGTKASFYMTLTKGIVRTAARAALSPTDVLANVNRTFFESAERGAFISMVYGIFDLSDKSLTVARAGHNPVILWKSSLANSEMLNPKGMALGLDGGNIFDSTIREMTVKYEPGDVFIFYTDGFTEALNKQLEEFGNERLLATAQRYHHLPAEELLSGIISETQKFTGRQEQRDDMTMVVIKIK